MPTRVAVDDDEQQIQDLIKEMRRLRSRLATTGVKGTHDDFTAAATPATTYQLTYIPVDGTCQMFRAATGTPTQGYQLREGTDYTVDYSTGIVTVSATQTSGDKLTFRYLVTDWLIARSLVADTGNLLTETEATFETGLSTGWVVATPFTPTDTTLTRLTSGGHTGNAFIRVSTAAGNAVQDLQVKLTRSITITDTSNYKVSFWVRSAVAGMRVEFQASLLDSGGTTLSALTASGSLIPVNTWTYVESPPTTTPTGTVSATVRLVQFGTSGGSAPGDTFDADDLFFGEG